MLSRIWNSRIVGVVAWAGTSALLVVVAVKSVRAAAHHDWWRLGVELLITLWLAWRLTAALRSVLARRRAGRS